MVRKNNTKVGGKNDILIKPTQKEKKAKREAAPKYPFQGQSN